MSKGRSAVRQVKRARVLLALHQGEKPAQAAQRAEVILATAYNIYHRYLEGKLAAALAEKPRSGQPRKVAEQLEAEVTRIACSEAPASRSRWTVRLINEKLVELGYKLEDE